MTEGDLSLQKLKDKLVIGFGTILTTCAIAAVANMWALNEKLAVVITTISYHDKEIESLKKWKDHVMMPVGKEK
jgi:hypothetical protein